jgi:hypothetical protein
MRHDPDSISKLVERELLQMADPVLVKRIRELLVLPYPVSREWDYGSPGQCFTCWTVLEHPFSNTGVAYCAEGFGPSYPWGLVFLTGPRMDIGMDCSWYASLEDAVRNSMAWTGENPESYEVN